MAASLPYEEPTIVTVLVYASFLLLLNVVNFLLDHSVYCGLLGQIFVGVAWGTPGAKWLAEGVEHVVVQLGYLGLILLVFEGGLSTSFSSLKANLLLSIAVAVTGISVPIGLSFVLQQLLGATPLQAFSAGAALCSTSLGTTFTVLSTSGLTKSRLGVVLTSAAMMDDVVGLVMVQVISNLGGPASSFDSTTVIRPVFVSFAFGVLVPLTCWLIVRPGTLFVNRLRESNPSSTFNKLVSLERVVFLIHTLILVAMVAGGSYAGTSNLFTAYLAGACISWWDTELPHAQISTHKTSEQSEGTQDRPSVASTSSIDISPQETHTPVSNDTSGFAIYENYYQQPVERILKPLFFASIGFSIPISRMFTGSIIWRGIVYTIPMLFGKLICGIWLIRFSISPYIPEKLKPRRRLPQIPHLWGSAKNAGSKKDKKNSDAESKNKEKASEQRNEQALAPLSNDGAASATQDPSSTSEILAQGSAASPSSHTSSDPKKPLSLYPASILGSAMMARGEIGFLISSLAESKGIFSSSSLSSAGDSEIYLVVTWAIMLCTIIGPLSVGMLVRRVKKLEKRGNDGVEGRKDVLGVWGVE